LDSRRHFGGLAYLFAVGHWHPPPPPRAGGQHVQLGCRCVSCGSPFDSVSSHSGIRSCTRDRGEEQTNHPVSWIRDRRYLLLSRSVDDAGGGRHTFGCTALFI